MIHSFLLCSVTKIFFYQFFLYIKITNNYYQKKKQGKTCERYQNLSEEEKDKRRKEGRERYKNLIKEEKEKSANKNVSEEQKKKLAAYRRNYYLTHGK